MLKINLADIKTTKAHNQVLRKALISVGQLKSKIQTVNFAWLEKGESFFPHNHDDCEELYFFLQGKGIMKIDNKKFPVKKGDFIVVEKGEYHSLENNKGKSKLLFLTIRVKI